MFDPQILKEYYFGFLFKNLALLFELVTGFIPILFCVLFSKTIWRKSKSLYLYTLAIFLLEIIGGLYSANSKPNHFIYLIFYFIESILLVVYYYFEIRTMVFQRFLIICLTIIITAIIYNLFFGLGLMDNYSGSIQSLAFIGIAIVCFYFILSKLEIKNLTKSTLFWVNTGNIVYFSGRFFICLFILQIMNEKEYTELAGYWFIVSVLLCIQRILITIGIYQLKYTEK